MPWQYPISAEVSQVDWDSDKGHSGNFHHNTSIPIFTPGATVGIYTVLTILQLMKSQLGLEAMLEYTSRYLTIIEKHNPKVKMAVTKALTLVSVEAIYRDAMRDDKK